MPRRRVLRVYDPPREDYDLARHHVRDPRDYASGSRDHHDGRTQLRHVIEDMDGRPVRMLYEVVNSRNRNDNVPSGSNQHEYGQSSTRQDPYIEASSSRSQVTGGGQSSSSSAPRVATKADAMEHHIPTSYNLKSWDPDKHPIITFGEVFDGPRFGDWISRWVGGVFGYNSEQWRVINKLWGFVGHYDDKQGKIEDRLDDPKTTNQVWSYLKDLQRRGKRDMRALQSLLMRAEMKPPFPGSNDLVYVTGEELSRRLFEKLGDGRSLREIAETMDQWFRVQF